METVPDVDGVLKLCHVLIKDQNDGLAPLPTTSTRRDELAEEQGWIARMVHLFKTSDLDIQFELLQTARRHFDAGGERMRFTFPALITSAIRLARRYKANESEVSVKLNHLHTSSDEVSRWKNGTRRHRLYSNLRGS